VGVILLSILFMYNNGMSALFLELIQQLNSAVWALLVILIVAFVAVWKVGQIVEKFRTFKDENKDIRGDIKEIKSTLTTVKATTDLLYQAHLQTVKPGSPLKLTEIGETIARDLSIDAKLANHWEHINEMFSGASVQNPYDVQVAALNVARDCFEKIFSPTEQGEIKTYAYNHGKNLLEIYPIIGIKIRDKVLSLRGIKPEEIDAHDPAKIKN